MNVSRSRESKKSYSSDQISICNDRRSDFRPLGVGYALAVKAWAAGSIAHLMLIRLLGEAKPTYRYEYV